MRFLTEGGGSSYLGFFGVKKFNNLFFLEYNNMEQAAHKLIIFYLLLDNKKIRRFWFARGKLLILTKLLACRQFSCAHGIFVYLAPFLQSERRKQMNISKEYTFIIVCLNTAWSVVVTPYC